MGAVLVLVLAVLVVRLFQLQVIQHDYWQAAAASVQERMIELPPRRGAMFDRNGAVLAVDVKAAAIAVDGHNVTQPEILAGILSEELGRPLGEISDLVNRPSYFTWIDRRVDLETAQRIERRMSEAGIYGLILIDTWRRSYPQGSLASNVIGFVGTDGEGLEGLELVYDEHLRGVPTMVHVIKGADGRTYQTEVVAEGRPGEDLALTLDAELQFLCEEEIRSGVSRFQADRGMLIVLDPDTGEVLAMAQNATYDLNSFWTSTADERRNIAVTYLFEPGSIFKVFAGLAALEAGVVSVEETFEGASEIRVAGHAMHNADNISYGTVTFAEIIEQSINTGMIQVAQRVGAEGLQAFYADLGFGRETGIELPGEIAGILRPAAVWSAVDVAAASIGQSVAVTGIQLARAIAVVAAGGTLCTPHIVQGGTDEDVRVPVASSASCEAMRAMMVQVVESGTGTRAAVPGFEIAGKTGTAQKAVAGRGYVDGKYTSLFAGLLTADDPGYVIVVVLDEVKTQYPSGGYTAGQIFQATAVRLLHHERIVPSVAW
ncbi:penicillin-binding protein 2 [Candidatus Bipolaricaulota bacterium]|nr:penicillin-binding protein 2 [Candidatus Bipolaricaulota bacterium]